MITYELVDDNHLTDARVLPRVRWLFRDADSDPLTESNADYLLRVEDSDLRATICVQTNDTENLHALAASRGIDPTSPE